MRVIDQLRELGIKPSKALGQNFLIDPSVVSMIVDFGRPKPTEQLVEIGPGLGALTKELCAISQSAISQSAISQSAISQSTSQQPIPAEQRGAQLGVPCNPPVLIEIEAEFCKRLSREYPECRIIAEDVRGVDFSGIGSNLVVFGNLPYSFSSDIIFHLVGQAQSINRAVLMLQKEFVERLGAEPGGRDYGVLSIMCQLWADVEFGPVISGRSFHPVAAVDSQLVSLTFLKAPRVAVTDLFWFKRVVSAAFTKRRKKLANSLKAAKFAPEEVLQRAFAETEIDPDRRPETLTLREFVRLAAALAVVNGR